MKCTHAEFFLQTASRFRPGLDALVEPLTASSQMDFGSVETSRRWRRAGLASGELMGIADPNEGSSPPCPAARDPRGRAARL